MRVRLAFLIAIAAGLGALFVAASPVEAGCGNNRCGQYGYGYGYQYAQPYYQQPYYQPQYYQPQYQQPVYYAQPVYQQPYYPPAQYARPCCQTNLWDNMFGGNGCCAQRQTWAQPGFVAEEPRRDWGHQEWGNRREWSNNDWSWSWNRNDVNIVNHGPVYVTPGNVSVNREGFGNVALASPEYETRGFAIQQPLVEETYVQPMPRRHYHSKPVRRLDRLSRADFSKSFPNAVIRKTYAPSRPHYVRARARPHAAWTSGNPSTSVSGDEIAPRKVLRE